MAKKIVDETLKFNIIINGDDAKKEYGQLERANRKLIDANKDLEKEAAKLKKAGKEQSDEYKKLTADLQQNTNEINKNKSRMNDLTEEIGINNLTMRQLRKEYGRLNGILNNLDPNTPKWQEYNKQLIAVKSRMSELRGEMSATTESMDEQLDVLGQFGAGFSQIMSGIKSGNYKEASQGFGLITGGIKQATKAAIAFIATPIGATLAVLAGIGFVVKEWLNYNDSIKESIILTEQITRLQGEQAESVRQRNAALKETFGTDEKEQLETARNLVEQFGISYEEAFDVIEDGLVKGQKNNNEYFDSLREYPTFFAQAGYSAQEFKDIISTGYDLGIYNDKLPDAIKEFDISIREQTKSTREALLNAFGQTFTDDLLARVKAGETSTKDALQEVSAEAERLGLNIEQNQRLTADVFRGAGEDAGGAIKLFQAVNIAANEATRALTPLEQSIKDLADANLELEEAQSRALKSDNYVAFTRDLKVFWIDVKTQFYNGVEFVTNLFTSGTDFLIAKFISITATASQLPTIITKGLKDVATSVLNTIKTFGGLGDVISKLLSFDFSGAKESAIEFKNNFSTAFDGVKEASKDTINDILDTQKAAEDAALKILAIRREGNAAAANAETNSPTENPTVNPNNGNNLENDDAAKKAEEKAIADALRKKQRVQDAIDKFDEEQAIRDQLKQVEKDQRAEEEEIIRKELEFVKLTEEAEGDLELLSQIEEAKEFELQAIRDRYAEERVEKAKIEQEKLLKQQEEYRRKSIEADIKLQQAKSNALKVGADLLAQAAGKQTEIGKFLFLFQKGMAVADVVRSASQAIAVATANEAMIPAILPPGIPNPSKAISLASTAKNILTTKIAAATSIASIVGQTLQGFEEGLYPVTRQQDGKQFNAGLSRDTSTRLVNNPTILVGERPEMIIDPDTFKRMDPNVTDYILQLAGKRPVPGYESGDYSKATTTSNETVSASPSNNTNDQMLSDTLGALVDVLSRGIKAKVFYGIEDEQNRQEIEDKLNAIKQASQN